MVKKYWIEMPSVPEGFGKWRRVEPQEWARADREGLPCLRMELRFDGFYEAVCWAAQREA